MNKKLEIYQDITENCDIVLNLLKDFTAENETSEGRMITQLKWLKERAENHDLSLPVDPVNLSTLRYVYTDGELLRHASSHENSHDEIEIYLDRLMMLTKDGRLLLKPKFFPYVIRSIDSLISVINTASRTLSIHEKSLIDELKSLRQLLRNSKIELPLAGFYPDYPSFREVYSITGSTIDDLENGKYLCKLVADLIFKGIRPDSWITTENADRETSNFMVS